MKYESKEAKKRHDVIQDHMRTIGARFGYCTEKETDNGTDRPFAVRFEFWLSRDGRRQYIVQLWPDGGWNVFAPLDDSNDTLATLAKVT